VWQIAHARTGQGYTSRIIGAQGRWTIPRTGRNGRTSARLVTRPPARAGEGRVFFMRPAETASVAPENAWRRPYDKATGPMMSASGLQCRPHRAGTADDYRLQRGARYIVASCHHARVLHCPSLVALSASARKHSGGSGSEDQGWDHRHQELRTKYDMERFSHICISSNRRRRRRWVRPVGGPAPRNGEWPHVLRPIWEYTVYAADFDQISTRDNFYIRSKSPVAPSGNRPGRLGPRPDYTRVRRR